MKHCIIVLIFLSFFGISAFKSVTLDCKSFSENLPSGMKKNNQALFYIERSKNRNRIYYDANFNNTGVLYTEHPIDVYWINLEENYGKRGELSYIQEKFAYGYKSEKLNDKCYEIKLKAFDKRPLMLVIDNKGKAKAQIKIQGKTANLHHLFIKASDKGLATTVEYVELFGTDVFAKTEVYEKFFP